MTLQAALNRVVETLNAAGLAQPQFEARQLAQDCLALTFAQMMSQPEREIPAEQVAKLEEWARERARGVPLAYLSRTKGFYKFDFAVEPGLLVPRPETELVVETVLRREEEVGEIDALADLGCGTGCLGLSLLAERSGARLWAADRDPLAIEVTQLNAERLHLSARLTAVRTEVEKWEPGRRFDVIVANPPYIAETDPAVDPHVRQFEPAHALFSGEDGFEALRTWSTWSLRHLRPGGMLVIEFGSAQGRLMQDLVAKLGFTRVQLERDLAGHERVISAFKKGRR